MRKSLRKFSLMFTLLLFISSTILSPISVLADQHNDDIDGGDDIVAETKADSSDDELDEQKDGVTPFDHYKVEPSSEEKTNQDENLDGDTKESSVNNRAPPVTVDVRVETHEETLVPTTEVEVENFEITEYIEHNNYDEPVQPDTPRAIHAIITALEENVDELDLKDDDDFSLGYGGNYIAGIDDLYEFTEGPNSGWMYYVDNEWVSDGVLERELTGGESIVLYYVVDYTDNTFSWFDQESYSVDIDDPLEVELTGVNFDDVNPVQEATILVDDEEYEVDGESVITDEDGKAKLKFSEPGTYHLSANRVNEDGDRNISRPFAHVEVTEQTSDESGEDIEPPVITVDGIEDDMVVTEKDLMFTVEATSDLDDEVTTTVTVNDQTVEEDDDAYNVELDEGENQIAISATDSVGNESKATYTVTYDVDEADEGYNIKERIDQASEYILDKGVMSEWEAIGLARAGKDVPDKYKDKLYGNVESQVDRMLDLGRVKITDIERLAMAAVAVGEDPQDIEGTNLIDLLYNSPTRGNSDTMTLQGNNGPIFALIALNTLDFPEPKEAKWTRQKLIEELLNNQNDDGSWNLSPAYDDASVDITAMAIIGLAPYKDQSEVEQAIEGAIDFLSDFQNDEGGFTESFVGGTSSEATAQAIIGLTAYGMDPTHEKFTKNGNNLIDHLLTYQNEDGGFSHLIGDPTNDMATEQALQALVAYDFFLEGKGRLYEFKDEIEADKINEKIENLPEVEELALENLEEIQEARQAYDDLTDTQKAFVENIDKLKTLEDEIVKLIFTFEETDEETIAITKYNLDESHVVIPEDIAGKKVTEISSQAFKDKNIKTAELPETLEVIEKEAFAYNDLSEVKIPKNVHYIDEGAFKDNKITTLSFGYDGEERALLEENVETVIEAEAFMNNRLTEIYLPEQITKIGERAFYNNYLENIEIDQKEANVDVAKDAFANNGKDSDVTITPVFLQDVDKTGLEEAINDAEKYLAEDRYTDKSMKALTEAAEGAKDVLEDVDATEEDVEDAIKDIEQAIEGLEVAEDISVDKTELKDALKRAESVETEGKTTSSIKELEKAIKNGKKVLSDEDASQKEVDLAVERIETAVKNLETSSESKLDKLLEELGEKIEDLKSIDPDKYTKESYDQLQQVMHKAEELLKQEDLTEADVKEAKAMIDEAIDELVEKDTNTPSPKRTDGEQKMTNDEKREMTGDRLPETATPYYTYVLIGLSLIVVAGIIYIIHRKIAFNK